MPTPSRLPFEAARAHVRWPRWRLRLAVDAGLLKRRADGTFARAALERVAGDPATPARLHRHERLVASQAAAELGISTGRFRSAAEAGVFTPVARKYWRHGQFTPLYRRTDVLAAGPALASFLEARRAAPRVMDPARVLHRHQLQATKLSNRANALADFEAHAALIDLYPAAEQRLVALLLWLGRVAGQESFLNYSADLAASADKAHAMERRLRAVRRIRSAALEALAAAGDPHLSLQLSGPSFILGCADCLAAEAAERPAGLGQLSVPAGRLVVQPGCTDCRIETERMGLGIKVDITPGLTIGRPGVQGIGQNSQSAPTLFIALDDTGPFLSSPKFALSLPYRSDETPSGWLRLGDPTMVRWADPTMLAPRHGDPLLGCYPGVEAATVKAMDPTDHARMDFRYRAALTARRAAGDGPWAWLPAWMTGLERIGGSMFGGMEGPPFTAFFDFNRHDRYVIPFERVCAEIAALFAGQPHESLVSGAIARELPAALGT